MSGAIVFDEVDPTVVEEAGPGSVLVFDSPRSEQAGAEQDGTLVLLDTLDPPLVVEVHDATQLFLFDVPSTTVVVHEDDEPDLLVISSGVLGPPGLPGLPGIPGLPGPIGPAGNGAYRHVQDVPSADWQIVHNLGFYPGGATVLDSAGTAVEGDIIYDSPSALTLHFSAPFAGIANLS